MPDSNPSTPPDLGNRGLFPDLRAAVYFNHAAISPLSRPVREAMTRVQDDYAAQGADAWTTCRDQRERLRGKLARMIGARAEDIALVASTTQGLVDVALCFPWQQGDRVLLFEGEFTTNVTPWQSAADLFGLEVVFRPVADFQHSAEAGLVAVQSELEKGVRLVAVSAVQFQTGLCMPLKRLAELCRAHGAELCVDAMQAVGAVPLDVAELGVDYLVCGSHKWLMAAEGCGFLYVRPERMVALRPRVAGWMSHEEGWRFLFEGAGHLRYDRPIRQRADFLEIGAMNSAGFAGLEASVDLLLELGVEAIFAHVQGLVDRLEEGFLGRGFESLRCADPAGRSCILSLRPPPGVPLQELYQGLRQQGLACAIPDGLLRLSPHWPCSTSDVGAALAALDRVLAALA